MTEDKEVTTQPAISTEEAAQTDEVLSPVGDEKTKMPETPKEPEQNDGDVQVTDA